MMTYFQVLCEALPLATLLLLVAALAIRSAMTAARVHQCLVVAAALALLSPLLVVWLPKWRILPAHDVAWIGQGVQRHWHDVSQQIVTGYDGWFCVLGWVWIAGVAWRLFQVSRQLWTLRRVWQQSQPISREIHGMVRRTLASRRLWRHVDVRLGSEKSQASTWGIWRPRILLPADVLNMSLAESKLILEHEIGHVRRFDALANWVLQVLCVVYWFHPLSWWITRRSQLCKELACDDLLVLSGVDADRYAACLGAATLRLQSAVEVPDWVSSFTRRHPSIVRLHAILDAHRNRSKLTFWELWRVSLPIGAVSLVFASLGFKVASEAQPQVNMLLREPNGQRPLSLWTNVVVPMVHSSQVQAARHTLTGDSSRVNSVSCPELGVSTPTTSSPATEATAKNAEGHAVEKITEREQVMNEVNSSSSEVAFTEARSAMLRRSISAGDLVSQRVAIPSMSARSPMKIEAPGVKPQSPAVKPSHSTLIAATASNQSTKQKNNQVASGGAGLAQAASSSQKAPLDRAPAPMASIVEAAHGEGAVPDATSIQGASKPVLMAVEPGVSEPTDQHVSENDQAEEWIVPSVGSIVGPRGVHRVIDVELPELEGEDWKIEVSADAKVWTDSPQVIAVEKRLIESEGKVEYSAMMTQPITETPYEFLRIRREEWPREASEHAQDGSVLQEQRSEHDEPSFRGIKGNTRLLMPNADPH